MRSFACCVRDVKADGFATPFFLPTLGLAERSFSDEVNRADSTMNLHPDDYSLYHVGYFDEEQGRLEPLDVPVLLMQASQALRKSV